jgi:hypothetical protein
MGQKNSAHGELKNTVAETAYQPSVGRGDAKFARKDNGGKGMDEGISIASRETVRNVSAASESQGNTDGKFFDSTVWFAGRISCTQHYWQ